MYKKLAIFAACCVLSLGAAAIFVQYEDHAHTDFNKPVLGHGGGLDSSGGHNCSAKSKAKGLCSGYHKHR